MSERVAEIVGIFDILPHPNADRLEIVNVHGGYPCVVQKGLWKAGDMAVYVPLDMLLPTDNPQWDWVGRGRTPVTQDGRLWHLVRPSRLRGVMSMGLLLPVPPEIDGAHPGTDAGAILGIVPYEEPLPLQSVSGGALGRTQRASDPGFLPVYDLEGMRRHGDILREGEPVVITEKIHGTSARFAFHQGKLWVASHKVFRAWGKNAILDHVARGDWKMLWAVLGDLLAGRSTRLSSPQDDVWCRTAKMYELDEKLRRVPGIAIYGEIYGSVQNLRYGMEPGEIGFAVFDAYHIERKEWLSHVELWTLCENLHLPVVPLLYVGPWRTELTKLAEGTSTIASHPREGMVVKSMVERRDSKIGRVALKLVGQDHLRGKEG